MNERRIRSRFPKPFFLAISSAEKRPASIISREDSARSRSIAFFRLGSQSDKDFLFSLFARPIGFGFNRRLLEQYSYDLDGLLRCA